MVVLQGLAEGTQRQQHAGAWRHRLGASRDAEVADRRYFGKGLSGADHVEHMLLAVGGRLEHPHQSGADHVHARTFLAIAEDPLPFLELD